MPHKTPEARRQYNRQYYLNNRIAFNSRFKKYCENLKTQGICINCRNNHEEKTYRCANCKKKYNAMAKDWRIKNDIHKINKLFPK
jgi:hypothetical protein